MSDPGFSFTDEALEAAFGSKFDSTTPTTPLSPDITDEVEDEPVDETVDPDATEDDVDDDGHVPTPEELDNEPDTITPTESPASIRIGDTELSETDARNLLELQELIASDPNFQQHLYAYFAPKGDEQAPNTAPAPTADPAAPPWQVDEEYLANPAFKSLYDINLKQWEVIQNLRTTVETFNEQAATIQRRELEATAENVVSSFKEEFKLSDEEIRDLRVRAARTGIVNNLIAQGTSTQDAFKQALEMAYWATPEFRSRDLSQHMEAQAEVKKKKARAASVSGSAGSAPRTAPKPKTEQERREAMAAELAQNWT